MNCSEIQNHLSAFLDGEIDAGAAQRIQDHLAECEACRQALADLRVVIREVRALEPAPAPDDFLEQLHLRLDSSPAPATWIKKLFRPLHVKLPLQLVTAMLVGGFIYYVVQTQQPWLITQPEKFDGVSRTAPIETQKSGKRADENLSIPQKDRQAVIEEKEEAARPMRKEVLKRLLSEEGVDSAAVRKKSASPDILELKRKMLEERQVKALTPSEAQTEAPAPEAPMKDKSREAPQAKERQPASRDAVIKLDEPIIYGPKEELSQKPAPAPKRQAPVIELALVMDTPSDSDNKLPRRSEPLVEKQKRLQLEAEMLKPRVRGLDETDSRETFEAEEPMRRETQAPPADMSAPAPRETKRFLEPDMDGFRAPTSAAPKNRALGQAQPQTSREPEITSMPAEDTLSPPALDQIIQLVKQSDGDVVDVGYSQTNGLPCTITASIPTPQARAFLKALDNVGQLTPPPEIPDPKDSLRITFRIRLLGSRAGLNCE